VDACETIALIIARGQHNCRCRRNLAQRKRDLEPVVAAEPDIQQDTVRGETFDGVQGRGRVTGFAYNRVAAPFEQLSRDLPELRMVVDDYDAHRWLKIPWHRGRLDRCGRGSAAHGCGRRLMRRHADGPSRSVRSPSLSALTTAVITRIA
jgi:hypothetical protein